MHPIIVSSPYTSNLHLCNNSSMHLSKMMSYSLILLVSWMRSKVCSSLTVKIYASISIITMSGAFKKWQLFLDKIGQSLEKKQKYLIPKKMLRRLKMGYARCAYRKKKWWVVACVTISTAMIAGDLTLRVNCRQEGSSSDAWMKNHVRKHLSSKDLQLSLPHN